MNPLRKALLAVASLAVVGSAFVLARHKAGTPAPQPPAPGFTLNAARLEAPPAKPTPGKPRPAPQTRPKPDAAKAQPLPAVGKERKFAAQQARALLNHIRAGRVRLTAAWREGGQLQKLGQEGIARWPPPPPPPPALPVPDWILEGLMAGALPEKAWETLQATEQEGPMRTASARALPSRGFVGGAHSYEAALEMARSPEPPSPLLLRMLTTLAGRSTPQRPLELMTLLRSPYPSPAHPRGSPTNTHSRGMAADIAAYAGHRIRLDRPEECVQMTLALLRAIPPGSYRLGLPKAPGPRPAVGRPPAQPALTELILLLSPPITMPEAPEPYRPQEPGAMLLRDWPNGIPPAPVFGIGAAAGVYIGSPRRRWPFFPAPEAALENGKIAPLRRNGQVARDRSGQPVPYILRFANSEYAPLSAIADSRVRKALEAARRRGADVWAAFPDAGDHIHIDVRPR